MKIIPLFALLPIIFSCNTTLGSRDTKFKHQNKEGRVASQVMLNKDGTFHYQYWGGLIISPFFRRAIALAWNFSKSDFSSMCLI